ncbi:MAG: SpoIIE family protein phosphatase [Firmicutes bacterium]|nr:SpoIIE family protein phosphatase [Bacillota bacterium]
MKNKRSSLRFHMITWIWGATMILLFIFLFAQYSSTKSYVIKDVEQDSFNLARFYSVRFEEILSKSAIIPTMVAAYLDTSTSEATGNTQEYLGKIIRKHPFIYSAGIAYEPGEAPESRQGLFFPTSYSRNGKIYFSGGKNPGYDYTTESWYKEAKETGKPGWSAPHIDPNNTGMLLFSYSAPFYQEGRFKGVASVSISLEQVIRQINNIRLARTGYAFLVGRNGEYLAFPDHTRILNGNIRDFNDQLGQLMINGKMGLIETRDPLRNERCLIVYHPAADSGLSLGFVYPEREVMLDLYVMEIKTLLLGLLGMASLLVVTIIISNSVITPVSKLAEGVSKMAQGQLNYKITVDATSSEVFELARAYNLLSENIENQINEIRKMEAEKERMESEIAIARRIQSSVIPSISDAECRKHKIDIAGITLPARDVGGDFYDFFFIDEDRVGFMLGDASGKGVPAAIYMAVCRALLRASALRGAGPGECLTSANKMLCGENYPDMFITVFYGILNTKTGALSYSNGGHMPPVVFHNGNTVLMEDPGNIPLGIDRKTTFSSEVISCIDGIVLYSDGVTDARNTDGDFFTTERLQETISARMSYNSATIMNQTGEILKQFADKTEQGDDITILVLKRN